MERRDFLKLGSLLPVLPGVTIARVSLDDVIVVSTEVFLSVREREFIGERLKFTFPNNRYLILEGGLKLSVIGKKGL